jgi:hypothetical protein
MAAGLLLAAFMAAYLLLAAEPAHAKTFTVKQGQIARIRSPQMAGVSWAKALSWSGRSAR